MKERFVKHATIVVERTYPVSPERVYGAWANAAAKAKWFSKPEIFEFRVGGKERSSGGPPEGPVFTFEAAYLELVPEQRIVYSYTLDANSERISASLATIELVAVQGGTKLIVTEQGAFLDGHDTPEIREHGTNALLDGLGRALEEEAIVLAAGDNELIAVREYDAPQALVFEAWTTPELLARWWGPEGFTNTFHECDVRPGGTWRYTMHGPDGTDYPNHSTFVEIVPEERVVLDHLLGHEFRVTATFEQRGDRTRVIFRQQFKHKADFEQAKPYCIEGNEQNLDRLGEALTAMASR